MGNVWPSGATGASGVPGLTSTKKLPSRKMRGRIANVASLWIGSPWSEIVIVTSAAVHPCVPPADACFCSEPPSLQPDTGPTLTTLPTLTPAILTGDSGFTPLALEKTACTVYSLANGLANLVNPR